jgi:D-3-phosphoglycerate dehydrogenase
MARILVTEEIADGGLERLRQAGHTVDIQLDLSHEQLLSAVKGAHALIIRSATDVNAEVLEAGTDLVVVGRAGVGLDNVDVDTATRRGVMVCNAPESNIVSAAEQTMALLLAVARNVPQAHAALVQGRWERSKWEGVELLDKTLGIVGLGRIGKLVATRAAAFGMRIVAFDPYISAERARQLNIEIMPLDQLVAESDFLTVHLPKNKETIGIIGREMFLKAKPELRVINVARGGIIDEPALLSALQGNQLRGAVLDVFNAEPLASDSPLRTAPNLLLTPHLGANTVEAQRNVSRDVCVAVRDALLHNDLSKSINVAGAAGEWGALQPAMLVARRAAAVARAVLADQGMRAVRRVALRVGPDLAHGAGPLLAAAAAGVLEGVIETDRLNLINARSLAEARGIELSVGESSDLGHPRGIEVALAGGMQQLSVAGAAPEGSTPRLTRIGQFHVDVNPKQTLLILTNHDVPGVIGRVGTLLGERQVNIAEYHQARLAQGGDALAAISVDGTVSEATRAALLQLPDVLTASVAHFGDG